MGAARFNDRFGSSDEEIPSHRRLLLPIKSSEAECDSFKSPFSCPDSDLQVVIENNRVGWKRQRKLNWRLVDPVVLAGSKYCPEVISQYVKTKSQDLAVDVKQHLFSLGWKIEFVNYDGVVKFRYTSPAGKSYFSLVKVCQHLTGSTLQMLPNIGEERRRCPDDDDVLDNYCCTKSEISMTEPPRQVVYKANTFPEAVIDWYMAGVEKNYKSRFKATDLKLKAKEHLSAMGWVLYYGEKQGKSELRYKSPTGKVYYSLRTACKGCIDGGGATEVGDDLNINNLSASPASESGVVDVDEESNVLLSGERRKRQKTLTEPKSSISEEQRENEDQLSGSACSETNLPDLVDDAEKIGNGFDQDDQQETNLPDLVDDAEKIGNGFDQDDQQEITQRRKVLSQMKGIKERSKCNQSPCVQRSFMRIKQQKTADFSHRNPRTVISLLMDNSVVSENDKVYYSGGKNRPPLAWGKITNKGIKCDCCSEIFTLSSFEAHAHSTKHRPAANIFLEDGRSLSDCKMQLMNCKKERKLIQNPGEKTNDERPAIENDSICSACQYGGELILCDGCPASFHCACVGLKETPDGDWFCPSCCCEICHQGNCAQLSEPQTDANSLHCSQCELKYHIGCLRSKGEVDLAKLFSNEQWFCSRHCQSLFLSLQKLLGRQIPVGDDNLTWTLLKSVQNPDTEAMAENYSKLNVALSVMHECFEPAKDSVTNRSLVEDVIFNHESEFRRLNFKGFYTVILERNDDFISAATVRVHGPKVAEVPLVGTRFRYRRLGMCGILMSELEKQLRKMGVERLVLPAVPSVLDTWTGSFGFSPMTESERLETLNFTFLEFQETIMCQKLLLSSPAVNPNCSPAILTSRSHLRTEDDCRVVKQ